MSIELKPRTRYLIRTDVTDKTPNGILQDIVIAELSASGEYVRVIWEASPDGIALPARQEWMLTSSIAPLVVEELPLYPSPQFRAATTPGLIRPSSLTTRAATTPTVTTVTTGQTT